MCGPFLEKLTLQQRCCACCDSRVVFVCRGGGENDGREEEQWHRRRVSRSPAKLICGTGPLARRRITGLGTVRGGGPRHLAESAQTKNAIKNDDNHPAPLLSSNECITIRASDRHLPATYFPPPWTRGSAREMPIVATTRCISRAAHAVYQVSRLLLVAFLWHYPLSCLCSGDATRLLCFDASYMMIHALLHTERSHDEIYTL